MNNLSLKMKPKALSDLISGLGTCYQDVMVTCICDDTRKLSAGDTFLCLPRVNNKDAMIAQAIEKGACAIIMVGEPLKTWPTVCVCLPDMQAVGMMLRRWFETENSKLPCIGITGTDGKTSTAWMLREVLALHLGSAWSCGTLGWIKDTDNIQDLGNTTPSLMTLHVMYALANQANIGALVLEVSSHGIAQQRIAGIPFRAAIWTTIGQDHLEDHGGFEAYLACKASFIKDVAFHGGLVVANADYRLIQQALTEVPQPLFWYAQHHDVDLSWKRKQSSVYFSDKEGSVTLKHAPLANFHAENLAAVALLMRQCFDVSLSSFSDWDKQITTPIGRLEPVNDDANIFIDYAHTAEGLKRCLKSAKDLTTEQLLLVFGCGGDRDKGKRPQMGEVAVKYADTCWLTSDNPRSEQQHDIAQDVLCGVRGFKHKIHVCHDRKDAIYQAVSALKCGDVLVIAGKGHEPYMETQGERLAWSDKKEALAAIEKIGVPTCA